MVKVLIVDDEEKICWLIQKLIDWDGLGLELAGTAGSGRAALSLIEQQRPDIVITDIKMPDMDGLAMIQAALDTGVPATFVVVSGYRQFEYAYSALKYGVEDYLLKPIKRKELNAILKKISSRIRQERAFSQESERELQRNVYRKNILQQQFLRELKTRSELPETLESLNAALEFGFRPGVFYAVIAKVDIQLNCVEQVKTDFICEHIVEMLQEALTEPYTVSFCTDAARGLGIVNSPDCPPHERLHKLLPQLQMYADSFECYRVSMSVSDAVSEVSDFPAAMRQAEALLGNRLFQGNRQLLLPNGRPLVSEESKETLLPAQFRYRLRREIEAGQISAFRCLVLEQFEWLERRRSCADAYYRFANLLAEFIFHLVQENAWAETMVQKERELYALYVANASSWDELNAVITERLGSLLLHCEEQRKSSDSRAVRIAKEYIASNYGGNLTLEEVAEKAGLSTAYFSLRFKKETGNSFSDYLLTVRIKAARDLLEHTDDTVACIAQNVGYRDVKYFSRLFRKMVGVHPSKYRKLHS